MNRFCIDCVFYQPIEDDGKGKCLRYAPRPFSELVNGRRHLAIWPIVSDDEGCGEHQKNK